jgi:hypothetical protein
MTTYHRRRKIAFRCLFALVTAATLAVAQVALGAGQSFGRSGGFTASRMHGQPSFSHPFHRFGFFGVNGFGEQDFTTVQQVQPAPVTAPQSAENRIYVQPQWVDGGYGVQVSQPGYWTVPKQAAEH